MISSLPTDCLSYKIAQLQMANTINFRLTGSRFFGTQHQYSDWDFFTEDTDHTKVLLTTWGFTPVVIYQGDATISTVLRWHKARLMEQIHVQLIQPDMIQVKEDAQQIIKNQSLVSPHKSEMCITWKAVIQTLLAAKIERPMRS